MSIDLEAQVLAVAEAMRERDADVTAAKRHEYYAENRQFILDRKRVYQVRNRVQLSANSAIYRFNNREAISIRDKTYYQANSEAICIQSKKYYADNREAMNAKSREYHRDNHSAISAQRKEYRLANVELTALRAKKYRSENAVAVAAQKRAWYLATRALKGLPRGESIPSAKLNEVAVREIREMHLTGRFDLAEIAARYGVTPSCIGYVVNRKTWKHVI